MAVKKSELYTSLWKMCDELRGGMDASQYKDYVLTLLFVKYVSDRHANKKDSLIEVPKGGSFSDMVALAGKKDIGEKMDVIIGKLATANDLRGVIDVAHFNDDDKLGKGKAMVDRLSKLVKIFDKPELDFGSNRADGDDLLGDAYEYLMRNFAQDSGKSKGQFYTPAEVSRIMSQVIGLSDATSGSQTIYDPTCGSGSLLLKAHDQAKQLTGHDLTIYGQEMDNATTALSKMNMILHDCPTAEVWNDNTLSSPHFKDNNKTGLKTFDFAVANPPFSYKSWSNGLVPTEDEFERFQYGIPPAKNGDYAFLLHVLKSLKSTGKGCIVMPHGVLFRGNVESTIRTNILKRGYIKGIIGLPANLFYGTGIPACLIVLDKEKADARAKGKTGIFMIDASKGFIKDGPKNRLREQDIHRIVDVFNSQDESDPKYARMVPLTEIERHEFNLNIPRYIDSTQPEDIQDIEAHLLGGIPDRDIDALSEYWSVYPNLRKALFKKADRKGYSQLRVPQDEIKQTIFEHPEFVAYSEEMDGVFSKWKKKHRPKLKSIELHTKPRDVIEPLAESILKTYSDRPLIDQYDIYQHLLTYWLETMKDDVYMIAEDGWQAVVTKVVRKKGDKKIEGTIQDGKDEFICELIPKQLLIDRYFSKQWEQIQQLEIETESQDSKLDELVEEHAGEDGLLAEVTNDKGNVSKGNVTKRVKQIKKEYKPAALKNEPEIAEELALLEQYLDIAAAGSKIDKQIKAAETKLEKSLLEKYGELTEDDVKTLVVDDKWITTVEFRIKTELNQISQELSSSLSDSCDDYKDSLTELTSLVELKSSSVQHHLEKLGFAWA